MSDHRRIQRTLFRMHIDPGFAESLLAGGEEAVASCELADEDLALVRALDPAGVSADPGAKRRTQVLGNAASEFTLTLAAAARGEHVSSWLEGFASSGEFHRAVRDGTRLPFAFARYAERRSSELEDFVLEELTLLEEVMARARRPGLFATKARRPAKDEVVLAAGVHLIDLRQGLHEYAMALRSAIDQGKDVPPPPAELNATKLRETLMVTAGEARPHRLAEIQVERLHPPTDELLRRSQSGFGSEARAGFARDQGAEPADLESFVAELVEDGVLVLG